MVTSENCSSACRSTTLGFTAIVRSSAVHKLLLIVILFPILKLPLLGQDNASETKIAAAAAPVLETHAVVTPARPIAVPEHTRSRFGVAVKASSLGVGADFGTLLFRHFVLRTGFTAMAYSRTVSDSGLSYFGTLHLNSVQAVVDWFPWSRAIHISPGLLLNNRNSVTANALLPTGQVLQSGADKFVSDPRDPIVGAASSSMRKLAPMLLFGFGNIIPRSRRFSVSSDFGVVFEGAPNAQFTLLGSACDPSGTHCQSITKQASIQSDIQSGQQRMQNDLSFMRFYPVVSVEFGYHF